MSKLFGDARPWQIVVIIIGALGAVGGITWSFLSSDAPRLVSVMTLADVNTGDIYELDISKRPAILPELNPVTGKATLIPVSKNDQGKWLADEKYLGGVDETVEKAAVREVVDEKVEIKLSGNKSTLK